tara:strand:- start:571 stop:1176 length:606 start_codon:yes stop_codon:yes gene_type:complete
MEVQQHGNYFEDLKIKELTGYGKEEYDSFKSNGYTSSMDLVEGLYVDRNYSIKTAKGNKVDCGDILRRMVEDDYNIVVGLWKQSGDNKIFHTEYTFNIKPKDMVKLWGNMKYEDVKDFDSFIKSIPSGKEAQQTTKAERTSRKKTLADKNALMVIHPKVDSKNQRRVQCSFKIDQMIKSGVEYTKKDINIVIHSPKRKFNK